MTEKKRNLSLVKNIIFMKTEITVTLIIAIALIVSVIIYSNGSTARQTQKLEQDRLYKEETLNMENRKQAEVSRREAQRRIDLQNCLNAANKNYQANWDSSCESRGREANCSLPPAQATVFNKSLSEDKDRCYKQ